MLVHMRPAVVLFFIFTLLTGLAYPMAITGLAQQFFPHQANGSLISLKGHVVGSELIGQTFTSARYFHGRPSATTDTDPADTSKTIPAPYNASSSAGSNSGPTSKALIERVRQDTAKLQAENPGTSVPVDLVTTSASGLDPHVTPAAAAFQVPRVARSRGIEVDQLRDLVAQYTQPRWLGMFGEPVVNVLELNLALDAKSPTPGDAQKEDKPAAAAVIPDASPTPPAEPEKH